MKDEIKERKKCLKLLNRHDKIDRQIINLVKKDKLSVGVVYVEGLS